MKELLLAEMKRRNVEIEFEDDIEEAVEWLKMLCLCTNKNAIDGVRDFVQYYIDNHKEE